MEENSIEKIIKNIEKDLKCVITKGNDEKLAVNKISTGINVLDKMIGGGLLRGRIHIFSGAFSTGKTFLAQQAIASVQNLGGTAAFIDGERRFDPEWFKQTGVDIDNLIVARPNFGEEATEVVLALVKSNVDIVVIDSLAALVPLAESEGTMEDQFMGLQARMLSKFWRKLVPINNNTIVVATNQTRSNIGDRFHPGVQETMPGGVSQYYYASLVLKVSRTGSIMKKIDKKGIESISFEESGSDKKKEGVKVGFMIECFSSKCNFAPPFQSCSVPFNFTTGQLDNATALISLAIDEGIIVSRGAWYNYKDKTLQGRQGVLDYFNDNPELLEDLRAEILK